MGALVTDAILIRIQAAAGAIFLLFLVVHLGNTTVASVGVEEYNAYQRGARVFYQNPIVETAGLLLPLLIHIATTVVRWRRHGLRWRAKSWRSRLHTATGLYLLTLVGGHVLASRGPSLFLGFHPEFGGLSFSLWWLPLLFYPYLVTFSLAALYHGSNGLLLAAAAFGRPLPTGLRYGAGYWVPVSVLGVLLVFGILGLAGLLYEVPDPTDNDYARMWESFGVDLTR